MFIILYQLKKLEAPSFTHFRNGLITSFNVQIRKGQ